MCSRGWRVYAPLPCLDPAFDGEYFSLIITGIAAFVPTRNFTVLCGRICLLANLVQETWV